jgi:hypothetical protein
MKLKMSKGDTVISTYLFLILIIFASSRPERTEPAKAVSNALIPVVEPMAIYTKMK